MKLINEENFLDEINKMEFIKSGLSNAGLKVALARFLSKHLKDLPKKKSDTGHSLSYYHAGGYNQCLEDCNND